MSPLDSRIAALKSRRRSASEFNECKPGPFRYLYVPVGAIVDKTVFPGCFR